MPKIDNFQTVAIGKTRDSSLVRFEKVHGDKVNFMLLNTYQVAMTTEKSVKSVLDEKASSVCCQQKS